MSSQAASTLADFPEDQFDILVFCETCGHQGTVDRKVLPGSIIVQELPKRLRCSSCGPKACSIRIVFTGAGGYQYPIKRLPGAGEYKTFGE